MGVVRRELQGMWNSTERCNSLLWKITFPLKVLVRDRISALIDPETEMWELGMTAGEFISCEFHHYFFCVFRPRSWIWRCAMWRCCCRGMIYFLTLCTTRLTSNRLARYMGWTPWLLPMMGQWKEAPSTLSLLRNSWDFRFGNWYQGWIKSLCLIFTSAGDCKTKQTASAGRGWHRGCLPSSSEGHLLERGEGLWQSSHHEQSGDTTGSKFHHLWHRITGIKSRLLWLVDCVLLVVPMPQQCLMWQSSPTELVSSSA